MERRKGLSMVFRKREGEKKRGKKRGRREKK